MTSGCSIRFALLVTDSRCSFLETLVNTSRLGLDFPGEFFIVITLTFGLAVATDGNHSPEDFSSQLANLSVHRQEQFSKNSYS